MQYMRSILPFLLDQTGLEEPMKQERRQEERAETFVRANRAQFIETYSETIGISTSKFAARSSVDVQKSASPDAVETSTNWWVSFQCTTKPSDKNSIPYKKGFMVPLRPGWAPRENDPTSSFIPHEAPDLRVGTRYKESNPCPLSATSISLAQCTDPINLDRSSFHRVPGHSRPPISTA